MSICMPSCLYMHQFFKKAFLSYPCIILAVGFTLVFSVPHHNHTVCLVRALVELLWPRDGGKFINENRLDLDLCKKISTECLNVAGFE